MIHITSLEPFCVAATNLYYFARTVIAPLERASEMTMQQVQKGFTLIELMVTITIVAVLLSVGIPAFSSVIDQQQLKGATETLASDLRRARSAAIAGGASGDVVMEFDVSDASDWTYTLANGNDIVVTRNSADFSNVISMTTSTGAFSDADADGHPDIRFSSVRAITHGGTGILTLTSGTASVELARNVMGMVSICSNGDSLGYPACTGS